MTIGFPMVYIKAANAAFFCVKNTRHRNSVTHFYTQNLNLLKHKSLYIK